ncbi:DotI/IcmL/TraM family protein [Vibrio sp. Hal054]|uniref:DotI/IcmL/TraM family protein n=1 Tax=Vibrio sp. Hal054 TaxID=3035158 RepID=UPI00301BD8AB
MHRQSLITRILIIVNMLIVGLIAYSVNKQPERQAIYQEDGKIKSVRIRDLASITDTKLLTFTNDVVATCFSLTQVNAESKSAYCADTYFSRNPAFIYRQKYADPIKDELVENDQTIYAAMPTAPVILQRPTQKRQYYTVFTIVKLTRVGRTQRTTQSKYMRLFIMPTQKSVSPYQFEIVGIQI